jgi:epoxyqueuosine reductase QueG
VPEARSVVSIAQPILNPVMDAPACLMDRELALVPPDAKQAYLEDLYGTVGHRVHDYMLEFIGQIVGQYLLEQGFDAMFFPTTSIGPWTNAAGMTWKEIWQGPNATWAERFSPLGTSPGPFSHRHAATRAGLGEFGYNNLVLTPEFGPRQRFNSIVTDAELVPDPLIARPICLRERCMLCLKVCHVDAIVMRDDPTRRDYRSVQKVDRECIFIDTPTKTYPPLCDARLERYPDAPVRGDCARVCPIPRPRKHLPRRLAAIVQQRGEGGKPGGRE